MNLIREFIADEVATPLTKGKATFARFRPGRVQLDSHGKIVRVETFSRSKLRLASKKSLYRARCLVPGLVDAHTHLLFAGDRAEEWNQRLKGATYEQIAAKGGGIKSSVKQTRGATLSEIVRLGKQRLQRASEFGITTLEIKTGYGLNLESELKLLKAIDILRDHTKIELIATFMGAHAVPSEFKSRGSYVDYLIREVLPKVRKRAEFQDVFCERGYFTKEDTIRLLAQGRKMGLKAKVHAHEFGRTGGVEAAAEVRACSADHLMHVSDSDLKRLRQAKVVPVVLPGTSLFLNTGTFAPAKKMLAAGLPVAIASDFNPGTNPTQNLLLCGTFAAIFQRLSLEEVLRGQTLFAAWALDRYDRGALEKGKRGDLADFDVGRFEEIYYRYGSVSAVSSFSRGQFI